jgi:metabolite-proton symporter
VSDGIVAKSVADRELRRVVLASLIGTTIEWYDFFLYGTAAALVFNKVFFPTSQPLTGTLIAFGTYALGFIARPIGGAIFGHFGDRYGRKRLLLVSLVTMGTATTLIGALPVYSQIGVGAPILLILLRLLQGFAVGGEWGGAVLLVGEQCDPKRRGFWTSWPQVGVPAGNLLAAGVLAIMSALQTPQQFISWGWRVPFLLSAVLLLFGWWLRSNLSETAAFKAAQALRKIKEESSPVLQAIRERPWQLLTGAGLRMGENISYYIITAFALTYLVEVRAGARTLALNALLLGAAAESLTLPLFATLSDHIGRRSVYAIGAFGMMLWSFALYVLLNDGGTVPVVVALVGGMFLHGAMYGPQAAFISELFPTRMRYSGVSLSYQVSSIIAGSLAPIIALKLYQAFHSFLPVAIYVAASCLISGVTALWSTETRGISLNDMG